MYYELERKLSKSSLTYDKQEMLAKQLIDLIDRKMKEREMRATSNLSDPEIGDFTATASGGGFETPKKRKLLDNFKAIQTGLAITANIKHERVPSIPFEPRKVETVVKVGPGTYDPNMDAVHKKLPNLTVLHKKSSTKPVPKKALESFINTIFSANTVTSTAKPEESL